MSPGDAGAGSGAAVEELIPNLRGREIRDRQVMSTLPDQLNEITDRFGPHLAFNHGLRLEAGVEPDKIVETHCCFCGQQCGIKLKVKDNRVIGFEPWEEFPFNRGMLCPKGVKRYLQGSHPDR